MELFDHPGTVNIVAAVSSNGLYILIGTSNGYLYLFNTTSNIPLHVVNIGVTFDSHGNDRTAEAIDVSPDGKFVAIASANTLKVYNRSAASLQYMWTFSVPYRWDTYQGIYSLSFSSDGKILVVGTWVRGYYNYYSYLYVFNTTSSVPIWSRTINYLTYRNQYDYVSVDVSSDGFYMIAGSTFDHKVYLFNQTSSTPIHPPYDTGAAVNSVSISSNGEYFAAGSNAVYYFRKDLVTPQWSRNIGGIVSSVSVSSNAENITAATGTYLYLLKNDSTEVWNFDAGNTIGPVSFSADGQYIVTKSGNYIHVFSTSVDGNPSTITHEPIWSYNTQNTVNSVSISSDGRYSVAGSGTYVYLFDATYDPDLTPTLIQFSNPDPTEGETITISATINNLGSLPSPNALVRWFDGALLIGTIQIGSISAGSQLVASTSCTLSPAGVHTIKAIVDPDNLVFESNEANNILTKNVSASSFPFVDTGANPIITEVTPIGTVNSASISGNGYYVAAGTGDRYIYLFFRNHTVATWSRDVGGPINIVTISKDGSYIASATGNTLYVFSRAKSVPLWSFSVPLYKFDWAQGIHSLSFSSDGKILVVGTWVQGYYSRYSYLYVFNATSSVLIWSRTMSDLSYRNQYDYVSVDVSSDGFYMIAGSTFDHNVYLFNQTSPTPLLAYDTTATVNAVSISAEGQYFVAGSNYVYYFSKDIITPLWSHDIGGTVSSVSISSDATYIAATRGTHLYLLRNDNAELWNYNVNSSVSEALISTDGNYTVIKSGSYAHLFSRTEDGNSSTLIHDPLWSYDTGNTANSISISSDGRYTAIASGGKIFYFDVLHKADLVPTSITFSNDNPNEGDTIIINAVIKNLGAYKAYYANVSFYDNQTLIGDAQISPLTPSASTSASLNYVCLPNHRKIKVIVDSYNAIFESNKTNNQLTTSLYVNARPINVTLNSPTDATSTSLNLSWSQNIDPDFARYELYMSSSSGQLGNLVATITDQSLTSHTLTNLNASTTYYFTLRTVDTGNAFSDSNQVIGTTLPTPVTLSNPTNPTSTSLDLSWTTNADQNFTRYEVYQSTSSGQLGTLITTITNQSQTTYTVTGLNGSSTYYFTIRVVNPQNLFSDSDQVSGTTAPTPVVLSNPTDPTMSSLTLSWSQNTDPNFQKYEIYISDTIETLGSLVTSFDDQAITTYNVTSLEASTTYYFTVRVDNPKGLFSNSNQVSGTTLSDFAILALPSSQTVVPGDSTSFTVNLTSSGPSTSVTLSISGLPSDANSSFNPSSVTPNGTSTLTITASDSTPGGSYTLIITGTRGVSTRTTTVTLVVVTITGEVVQEETGTITFSLSETLEESRSFTLLTTSVSISAKADISITMPADVTAETNATVVKKGSGAWIIITATGKSATIKVTVTVTVSVGGQSETISRTWTKSFTTPVGSSEVSFDKISIPAISTLIGSVTVDLTPRARLDGHVAGDIAVSGPATANVESLTWMTQGSKRTIFVTFSEEEDVEVLLSSATLSITEMTLIFDVGASVKPIFGSPISKDLGSLSLPISTSIRASGSPASLTIAEFSVSTGPLPPGLLSSENLYWIALAAVIGAVAVASVVVVRRKRRRIAPKTPSGRS